MAPSQNSLPVRPAQHLHISLSTSQRKQSRSFRFWLGFTSLTTADRLPGSHWGMINIHCLMTDGTKRRWHLDWRLTSDPQVYCSRWTGSETRTCMRTPAGASCRTAAFGVTLTMRKTFLSGCSSAEQNHIEQSGNLSEPHITRWGGGGVIFVNSTLLCTRLNIFGRFSLRPRLYHTLELRKICYLNFLFFY